MRRPLRRLFWFRERYIVQGPVAESVLRSGPIHVDQPGLTFHFHGAADFVNRLQGDMQFDSRFAGRGSRNHERRLGVNKVAFRSTFSL